MRTRTADSHMHAYARIGINAFVYIQMWRAANAHKDTDKMWIHTRYTRSKHTATFKEQPFESQWGVFVCFLVCLMGCVHKVV